MKRKYKVVFIVKKVPLTGAPHVSETRTTAARSKILATRSVRNRLKKEGYITLWCKSCELKED